MALSFVGWDCFFAYHFCQKLTFAIKKTKFSHFLLWCSLARYPGWHGSVKPNDWTFSCLFSCFTVWIDSKAFFTKLSAQQSSSLPFKSHINRTYIIFRASEAKDLAVDEPAPMPSVHDDRRSFGMCSINQFVFFTKNEWTSIPLHGILSAWISVRYFFPLFFITPSSLYLPPLFTVGLGTSWQSDIFIISRSFITAHPGINVQLQQSLVDICSYCPSPSSKTASSRPGTSLNVPPQSNHNAPILSIQLQHPWRRSNVL